MSKARLVGVVAAVATLGVVGSAVPVQSQQPAERQTITFFDPNRTEYERFVNEGRRGLSPGDVILFVDKQLDPETCDRLGSLTGRLQIIKTISDRDARFSGEFTVTLAGGKIVAGGAARFSEFAGTDPVFAVTGGTETYRDASGEVSFQEDVRLCDTRGTMTTIDLGPQP